MDLDRAQGMAIALMAKHGLIDDGWRFRWDNAKTRAGCCRCFRRIVQLSRPCIELCVAEDVRQVILHEIAHALAPYDEGHGARWQAILVRIGGHPEAYLPADLPSPPAPWRGTCGAGHRVERYRAPTQVLSCRQCHGGFNLHALLDWTRRGVAVAMPKAYLLDLICSVRCEFDGPWPERAVLRALELPAERLSRREAACLRDALRRHE
jgi:predicted SprT family Zn-dependent metalloprotease